MKVSVIGAGAMGANHVRVLRDMEGVEIGAVIDRDLDRATAVAHRYGATAGDDAFAHLEHDRPDAVVVAVPTSGHVPIALAAIERGLHVLVEKPIAETVEEAQTLVDAAARHGVTLAVGHIERCNPAVVELKRRLDAGELGRTFMLHSRRLSPFPARITDVGVAADLATHEVDMMRYLTGAEVERVSSSVSRVIHPTHEDLIVSLLRFENGVLGVLDVNWVTPTKIRDIHVTGERGMFTVNYLTQELCFFANAAAGESFARSEWPPTDAFSIAEGPMVRHHIAKREPLLVELESFLDAARTGGRPVVDGQDGLEAVRVAIEIVTSGTDQSSR